MTEGEGTSEGTQGTGAGTGQVVTQPAWLAQLPADLKTNEVFTKYQTIGDLGKTHVDLLGKIKEFEGKTTQMEASLKNSIPKLPENATKEQIEAYHTAIGRPPKPEDYQFEPIEGVEHSPEFVKEAQRWLYDAGVSVQGAKVIQKYWDTYAKAQVEVEEAEEKKLVEEAHKAYRGEFKTEEEFKVSEELTKRFWNKITGTDFDKAFAEVDAWKVPTFKKFIAKLAKMTGEDSMPPGANKGVTESETGMIYDKTPQHMRK